MLYPTIQTSAINTLILLQLFLLEFIIVYPVAIDRFPRHFSGSVHFYILFLTFHAQGSTDPGGGES